MKKHGFQTAFSPLKEMVLALDLSVVVVTHRTREQVRDCLASLIHGGGISGINAEVILVDNASGDGTVEMARAEFPTVRLLANQENVGFSRGNNQGIEAATGRNVLLLNPDTLVPDGQLAKCVHFLEEQAPNVAAMTCRVESTDGTYQWTCSRRLVTPWSETCRNLLLDRVFPRSDFFNHEPDVHWDRTDTRPVECLLGAFMLIRRTALDALGSLDERFFLMYEDADWCRRAKDAGWTLLFWPGARITHIGGGFWKQEPVVTFANSYLSAMAYFRKHHPRAVRPVHLVSRAGMALKIGLLRLNLLRKPGDDYTVKHLEMARAAQKTLRTGTAMQYGNWADTTAKEAAAAPVPQQEAGENEKPRILYVATVDIMIWLMRAALDALREQGFTVDVACSMTRHEAALHQHADNVFVLPFRRSPAHPGNLLALFQLTRLLKTRGYLVMHAHTPVGGFIGRLAATLAHTPVRMYTAHGFHFHRYAGTVSNALYRTIETIAGRFWSDGVIVINQEDFHAAQTLGVVRPDRLFLTSGVGVSTRRFDPARVSPPTRTALRAELGAASETTPVLMYVAEMIPRKRHTDALAALAEILKTHPDARLILIGEGVKKAEVEAEARTRGVGEACRFLGFRSDMVELLACADVVLFPSKQEGLPAAIEEALCMEVPVVAADVRGNHDLVQADCGRLVPPGDAPALARAVLELLALPSTERRGLGRSGRARMVKDFDHAVCITQWMEVYALLLRRKGLSPPHQSGDNRRGETSTTSAANAAPLSAPANAA